MLKTFHWYMAIFDSPNISAILDVMILMIAFFPAVIVSGRIIFSDSATVLRLQRSPVLMGWMFFFCGLEVFFHLMKVPILLKALAVLLGIILIPIVFLVLEGH